MSTSLLNVLIALNKEIADDWAGTTTSSGSTTKTTVVDTALMAKANDWITDDCFDFITSAGSTQYEERKISSLDNTNGTLTVLAHTATIAASATYQVHRLFSASAKRTALIDAAKLCYPFIHKQIRDESLTIGNWLRDGDFEYNWSSTAAHTYWKVSNTANVTIEETTTAPYFKRGATSLKLAGSAGYLYQSNTENSGLMNLADNTVTVTAEVWGDTASDLRVAITDGAATTYSSYHTGASGFEKLTVTADMATYPSAISVRVYRASSTSVAYVDDIRLYGPDRAKLYITDLGLNLDYPIEVFESSDENINLEPWIPIRDYSIGSDGYIYLEEGTRNYRVRITGRNYLDFLVSNVASTAWTATIALNEPQIRVLVAQAICYLYEQMALPNFTSGDRQAYAQALTYWQGKLAERQSRFGMKLPPIKTRWGI